jgi:hypothetical protein
MRLIKEYPERYFHTKWINSESGIIMDGIKELKKHEYWKAIDKEKSKLN